MKRFKNIFALILMLSATSCGEELLDITPSTALPPDIAIQSVADMETVLLGVYSQMQNSDYYGRYFILVPDVMSDDVKQNASANRAKEWAEFNGNEIDFIAEEIWTEVYEVILRANTVINSGLEFPAAVKDLGDQLLGEAYAIRALAHFDIARIYAQTYNFSSGGSHPGVPIVTEFDPDAEPTRATVGEVYQAVLSDLDRSISLMNQSRGTGFFSRDAAVALQARIALYMSDFAKAESLASQVIDGGNFSLTSTEGYLDAWAANGSAPDVIFEVIMTESDNNGGDALGRMYINEGYGDYLPSLDLVNLIDSNDIRSQLFKFDETLAGVYGTIRVNKFPNINGEDNTPVIRLSELYLIRAEARAMTGNEAGAIEDLMTIRQRAWPTAPAVTATGEALLDEIEREKRIELMFEGHRLWDLMRKGRSVMRTDCTAPICEINYPNERFILPIPQQELVANPNISQNPGY